MDKKETERTISVAIDGPSGSGKSTLSRAAAKELSLLYVDTGAIYRTTALHTLRRGVSPGESAAVAALLPEIDIALSYDAGGMQRMCLNGEDVTELIRTQEVSMAASAVSAYPAVLPGADVKIFLTAGSEVRARRRWLELQERGTPRDWEQLLRETRERDEKDANRAESPLRPAEDSVVLDTSGLNFSQSLKRIVEIIRERTGL